VRIFHTFHAYYFFITSFADEEFLLFTFSNVRLFVLLCYLDETAHRITQVKEVHALYQLRKVAAAFDLICT